MPRKKAEPATIEATVEEPESNGTTEIVASSPAVMSEGTYALAMLSDDEFQSRMEVLKRGRDRVKVLQQQLMVPEEDYGLIPGTPKPTLFKSGAEKLCQFYRLAARLEKQRIAGDNETTPPLQFDAQCYLHLGSLDGPVVATGHGTANSWEKRYLRGGSKQCPSCEKVGTLIVGKYGKNAGGWYCFPKKGGCGSDFPKNHPDIESQTDTKGVVTDAYDLGNTLMKMAEKRAFVDATLRATATSGLFTQDVVEDPRDDEDTVTTEGGAVVDTETGEVRGRTTSATGNPDEDHAAAAYVPEEEEHSTAWDAKQNELAAAGNATDPKTGKVDADRILPDPDEPELRQSNVEGIGRGGVTSGANGAQIAQVKAFAKAIHVKGEEKPGLGPWRLADEISLIVGGGIDSTMLPEDRREAGVDVAAFLETMSSDDIGKLITRLRKMSEGEE